MYDLEVHLIVLAMVNSLLLHQVIHPEAERMNVRVNTNQYTIFPLARVVENVTSS